MNKLRKTIALCSICAIALISSPSSVSAADNWAGFQDVTIGLSFGTLGKAAFFTSVIPTKGTYYSKITMKLQRYTSGSWKTLSTGSYGDTGLNTYGRYYYVTKGYSYRVHSTVTIYKSKGGSKINSDTFIYKRKY